MSTCEGGNDYDGQLGTRVSAIFVILVGSWAGALFPVIARRHPRLRISDWAFFVAKFFGSGVIIATAFIHLLAPANEALGDPCLEDTTIGAYPWVEGIALMTVFLLFFVELITIRYAKFEVPDHDVHEADRRPSALPVEDGTKAQYKNGSQVGQDGEKQESQGLLPDNYSAQLTGIFILEFGVIFHSIFIGLTLAVAGDEFITLYIVLVFHQTFEGLGLGSRLAMVPWPKSKKWTPYILATAYGLTTPIAIAAGLGVRNSLSPGSRDTLITNGVFDSISAGILLYTGLIELIAHEFLFNSDMRNAPIAHVMFAFGLMVLGAGLMAVIGFWA